MDEKKKKGGRKEGRKVCMGTVVYYWNRASPSTKVQG